MAEPARRFWTLDEFLVFDDGTDRRYELFDGQIVAMAPASDVHGALVARLGAPDRHDPKRFLLTGGEQARNISATRAFDCVSSLAPHAGSVGRGSIGGAGRSQPE